MNTGILWLENIERLTNVDWKIRKITLKITESLTQYPKSESCSITAVMNLSRPHPETRHINKEEVGR
jgi:hypothetical protein